jgi:methylthioribose-1-phosphate isomerase
VNLFWAIERMRKCAQRHREDIKKLEEEASRIHKEDEECCAKIGIVGEKLLEDEDSVLTHCNAGALATGGDGTALSIIYAAKKKGKKIKVYVDETRPLLQGARLTCFELLKRGIKPTLICDSLAPYLMKIGKIKKVIVGADRITRRGDVANKVGTYTLALSAKEHKIPFYVAAPSYSFDLSMEDGERIKIEERGKDEVKEFFGKKCCPEGVDVLNLAFDVTPASFVTAFVTECGIIYPPFEENIPSTLQ